MISLNIKIYIKMYVYEVVVGIDFGSSGTGYAYSFNNPKKIDFGKFPFQNYEVKSPTQIILDSNLQNVLAFGKKCDSYQLKEDDLYFKRIKMYIYKNETYIKPENNSKSFPLVDIITKIFLYIKEEAIKTIKFQKPNITENQIKWVVTVPSIWNYTQKGIMISASEKAGFLDQNTDKTNFLALEPEVASIYCSYDDSIDHKYLEAGKTYIICDLGGGTGDIVTHHKKEDNKIIEKYRPIGGPYGSDEIEKDFFNKIFGELFGFDDFNSLYSKYDKLKNNKNLYWNKDDLYTEWKKLEEEIKTRKKVTKDLKDQSFKINCQIFEEFVDTNLKDLVNIFNNSCKEEWKIGISNEKRWILDFPYKIFFDLIEKQALQITEQISEICSEINDIESILYVGGYCSNEVLIFYFKEKFYKLNHLKPSQPEIAVVKGAVLFGINPYIINMRKFPYTLGFNCDDIWNEEIHGGIGEKYYDSNYNIYKCKNSFHIIIKKEQEITPNETITLSFVTMNPRIILLKFFISNKENPVLWTEEGVELIGTEHLDLGRDYPENERDFIIKIKFGGTYADAKCLHDKSRRELSFPLYFNK